MGIEHNGTLYVAGQLPLMKGKEVPATIEAQTRLVLSRIDSIVKGAGSSRDSIIQVRIYLADIGLWERVNKVYAQFFGDHKPVRAVIPTKALHYGCLIEAEAVAAL